MIKEILKKAGFIENKTFKETRFLKPPKTTYAVYMDSYDTNGGDYTAFYKRHSIIIELYSYAPDKEAERCLERVLYEYYPKMLGGYTKQDRYWLNEEQLFQVIYEFEYIEK